MVVPSGEEDPVVQEYDWAADSPCFAVIDTIARYEDIETDRMADDLPILEEAVDTDALEALFRSARPLAVSFTYAGYNIHLTQDTVAVSRTAFSND